MKYRKYIPSLLLWGLSISSLSAQNTNFYATAGTVLFSTTASISAEMKLTSLSSKSTLFYAKATGGINHFIGFDGPSENTTFLGLTGVLLLGKNNKYFEVDLGTHLLISRDDPEWHPRASLGYRYQNDRKIFRVGVGFVDWIYVSFGRSF